MQRKMGERHGARVDNDLIIQVMKMQDLDEVMKVEQQCFTIPWYAIHYPRTQMINFPNIS